MIYCVHAVSASVSHLFLWPRVAYLNEPHNESAETAKGEEEKVKHPKIKAASYLLNIHCDFRRYLLKRIELFGV